MVLGDFFDLSDSEYRSRIAGYDNLRLRKQEVVKLRQEKAALASMIGGVGIAGFTGGISLIGTAIGVRRLNVAGRKLKIIREEMETRGLSPHNETDRDEIIPVLSSFIGLGTGLTIGIEAGIGVAADAATSGAGHHGAAAALENAMNNPVGATVHLADKVAGQTAASGAVTAGLSRVLPSPEGPGMGPQVITSSVDLADDTLLRGKTTENSPTFTNKVGSKASRPRQKTIRTISEPHNFQASKTSTTTFVKPGTAEVQPDYSHLNSHELRERAEAEFLRYQPLDEQYWASWEEHRRLCDQLDKAIGTSWYNDKLGKFREKSLKLIPNRTCKVSMDALDGRGIPKRWFRPFYAAELNTLRMEFDTLHYEHEMWARHLDEWDKAMMDAREMKPPAGGCQERNEQEDITNAPHIGTRHQSGPPAVLSPGEIRPQRRRQHINLSLILVSSFALVTWIALLFHAILKRTLVFVLLFGLLYARFPWGLPEWFPLNPEA